MTDLSQLDDLQGVLFDLDGTLVDVDMYVFIPAYLRRLSDFFSDLIDARRFRREMLAATTTMLQSKKRSASNEEMLLSLLFRRLGIGQGQFQERLQQFINDGLDSLRPLVQSLPLAHSILQSCADRGLRLVLATNPVFPLQIVEARLRWGGLANLPFDLVTSYENSRYCKPDRRYFEDVLDFLQIPAETCLMVGNDTDHDLAAQQVGISTFLVDTCLVNRGDSPFEADWQGNHGDLLRFLSVSG